MSHHHAADHAPIETRQQLLVDFINKAETAMSRSGIDYLVWPRLLASTAVELIANEPVWNDEMRVLFLCYRPDYSSEWTLSQVEEQNIAANLGSQSSFSTNLSRR